MRNLVCIFGVVACGLAGCAAESVAPAPAHRDQPAAEAAAAPAQPAPAAAERRQPAETPPSAAQRQPQQIWVDAEVSTVPAGVGEFVSHSEPKKPAADKPADPQPAAKDPPPKDDAPPAAKDPPPKNDPPAPASDPAPKPCDVAACDDGVECTVDKCASDGSCVHESATWSWLLPPGSFSCAMQASGWADGSSAVGINAGNGNAGVAVMAAGGQVVWQAKPPQSLAKPQVRAVLAMQKGGVAAAFGAMAGSGQWLGRFDPQGKLLASIEPDLPGPIADLAELPCNALLAAGMNYAEGTAYVARFEADLTLAKVWSVGLVPFQGVARIAADGDANWYLLGTVYTGGPSGVDIALLKLNGDGQVVLAHKAGSDGDDKAGDLTLTATGVAFSWRPLAGVGLQTHVDHLNAQLQPLGEASFASAAPCPPKQLLATADGNLAHVDECGNTARVSANGQVLSTTQMPALVDFGAGGGGPVYVHAATARPDGTLVLSGAMFQSKKMPQAVVFAVENSGLGCFANVSFAP